MSASKRLQQIQEMLKDEPNDAELRYMLAMEHVSLGDDEQAVRCFLEAIDVATTYPPAYHQAGRVLQRLNRLPEARALLEKGIPIALQQGNQHAAGEMQELLASLE